MPDTSYFREKAEQCLRLARESTDPMFVNSLTELAQEYNAQANAIEASALGEDPEDDKLRDKIQGEQHMLDTQTKVRNARLAVLQ